MMGAFGVITGQFGEPATWTTAPGGPVAGSGLFKEPTNGNVITPHARNSQGAEFDVASPQLEYRAGMFPGLKEAAANTSAEHLLTIRDRVFLVGAVKRIFDGETYVAILQELNPAQ